MVARQKTIRAILNELTRMSPLLAVLQEINDEKLEN